MGSSLPVWAALRALCYCAIWPGRRGRLLKNESWGGAVRIGRRRGVASSTDRTSSAGRATAAGGGRRAARGSRQRRQRIVSAATVGVLGAGLVLAGILYDGVATADVDLNDGGVWVTSREHLRLGRLNSQVQLLDGGLRSEEHTLELQSRGQLVCRLLLEKKKQHNKR